MAVDGDIQPLLALFTREVFDALCRLCAGRMGKTPNEFDAELDACATLIACPPALGFPRDSRQNVVCTRR